MINKDNYKKIIQENKFKISLGCLISIVLLIIIIVVALSLKSKSEEYAESNDSKENSKILSKTTTSPTTKVTTETTVEEIKVTEETTTVVVATQQTTTNVSTNAPTIKQTTKEVATEKQAPAPVIVTPPVQEQISPTVTPPEAKKVITLYQKNTVATVPNPTDEQLMASLVFQNMFTGEIYSGSQIYTMQWYYTETMEGNPMVSGGLMLVQNPYGLDLFVGGLTSPESNTIYNANGTDIEIAYGGTYLSKTIHISNATRVWDWEQRIAEFDKITYITDKIN